VLYRVLIWTGVERLLLLFFWMARALFILQGVAFVCASVTTFAVAGAEAPAWLQGAMVKGLLISGTFFAAGLLLMVARRWLARATGVGDEPTWPWPLLLGLSLLGLPAVAGLAASGLPSLWSRIGAQLAAINFWDAIARNDPYGGIVLLPILLALSVPVLLTAASAFSIAFPLTLLPLLVARRRLFPTLLAMGVICQVALVLTGWMAADVLARLATQALAAMAASGDAEVLRVAEDLDWATGILTRTAFALVAPMLGMLAWSVFLRPSGPAAGHFAADASLVPDQARGAHAPVLAAPQPWIRVAPVSAPTQAGAHADVANARPKPGVVARVAQVGLGALGALMLMVGAADGLRPRASYVSSQPVPGATLASVAAVRVTFAARLDPGSSVSLIRLAGNPSAGEAPRDVEIAGRLAPDDPERRTIEGVPARRLSPGLYRLAWWARPAGGGGAQYGSFSFGVDVPVPGDTTDDVHSVSERDAGARRRRQTVLGGLLLLVLSAILPRLSARA